MFETVLEKLDGVELSLELVQQELESLRCEFAELIEDIGEEPLNMGDNSFVGSIFTRDDAWAREIMKNVYGRPFVNVNDNNWGQFVEYVTAKQADSENDEFTFFEQAWDRFSESLDE